MNTLKSLSINIEAAQSGRIWNLLPPDVRDSRDKIRDYPLPDSTKELEILVAIPIPAKGQRAVYIYLKRAKAEWDRRYRLKVDVRETMDEAVTTAGDLERKFQKQMSELERRANQAVVSVEKQAEKAIASLDELFKLGRQGIESQMRAYVENTTINGEEINASAFRQCFKIVAGTVKGMGLPSDQKPIARQAVMKELADSFRATEAAVAMAKPTDGEAS